MTELRVLIVDDEPYARRRLTALVGRTQGAIVVGEADHADRAMALVRSLDPDVVMLDIRMPGRDGMALARELAALGPRPAVVFTTAYGDRALDAFDTNAADYLLKPISGDKLARALARAAARAAIAPAAEAPSIVARSGDLLSIVPASAIARFHADQKYTLFRHQGVEHLIEESLSSLEERLTPWGFLRVHRAELIQLRRVRAVNRSAAPPTAELDDGQLVPVSRRRLPALLRQLA